MFQRLGEHVLLEREVGHQALASADAQMGVLLFPDVEGGFADAELPANIRRGRPALDLAEGVRDLLFGKLRLLHRSSCSH